MGVGRLPPPRVGVLKRSVIPIWSKTWGYQGALPSLERLDQPRLEYGLGMVRLA